MLRAARASGHSIPDDHLSLEFSAPRALYLQTDMENLAMLRACKHALLPEITAASRSLLDREDVRYQVVMAWQRATTGRARSACTGRG